MNSSHVDLIVTPHGQLVLQDVASAPVLEPALAGRLREAFERGAGHGLLQLGAAELAAPLPPSFSYWRELASGYVTALCALPDAEERGERVRVPAPPEPELQALASAVPPMTGAEYVSAETLAALWESLDAALSSELHAARVPVQDLLKRYNPAWNLVGRVHFNLAENRKDEEAPFAFLATYTHRLASHRRAQHIPLGQALREYAGAANTSRLLSLLLPVQRAAERCAWLRRMVETGEIFHPLRWTPREAFELLADVPQLESAGVIVRMPAGWRAKRPPRPRVTATIGGHAPSRLGQESLLDFRMDVTLDGEVLTAAEVADLLSRSDGLVLVRGRWVEIDRDRLGRTLEHFREVERAAAEDGVSFSQAMRMLAGAEIEPRDVPAADPEWSKVVAGPWLAETVKELTRSDRLAAIDIDVDRELRGTLRPYQKVGVRWLYLLSRLELGGCLADDMGLGKTIQVLSLLLALKGRKDAPRAASGAGADARGGGTGPRRSLIVAPASLLANWTSEIERFAPALGAFVSHPSVQSAATLSALTPDHPSLEGVDLVLTSYGSLLRQPWLTEARWNLVVLDEAQAIKNPDAKQTRAAKKIVARARFALTGTPVENSLADLWSLFDFVNPGLLGSSKLFATWVKRLAAARPSAPPHHISNPYAPLRDLVAPYILRRMKTDRSVIADLPDKTEVKAWCQLSRKQAALYQQAVKELARQLERAEGIRRKGIVLSFLMRFKQICNHPSQWLGDGEWKEADSGKWIRLREIAEIIAAKQEKVLVFTQFREIVDPLERFLSSVFGRQGVALHGETEVRKRSALVRRFQEDEQVPYFVLSLKAGGAGLNLTAASHVVHFDRWWNPAVEDQATDRAFRIGQVKNVLVHKFLCRGTVEDKIDELIASKVQLSRDVLAQEGAEPILTEMTNEELLSLVALDIRAAVKEA